MDSHRDSPLLYRIVHCSRPADRTNHEGITTEKPMRAILIDPEAKTITEVQYDGNYKSIYKLIDCETFTFVGIDGENVIFVDDEGLFKEPKHFFIWKGYPQPLSGKGLILDTDDEGDSIATDLPIDYVKSQVKFTELSLKGFDPIPEGAVTGKDHWMGEGVPIIGHVPVFGPPEEE